MKQINMMLMSDFYKQGHPEFYPEGQNYLFTCGTPRMSRITGINEMVVWGIQAFAMDYLIERFNDTFFKSPKDEVVQEVQEFISQTFNCTSFNINRIADIHDLGYLPVRLWALPEGTVMPVINQKENPDTVQVPFMAYESTHEKFAWVAEFLESITSCQTWYPMVIATVAKFGYRDIVNKHWEKSVVGQPACTAISEFGFRGAEGSEGAIMASAAFLTCFNKTATVPAIDYLKHYYGKGMTLGEIGSGMSSTEHSTMCSNYSVDGNEDDFMIKLFTKVAPSGNLSVVCDSYDYWGRINALCTDRALKQAVLNRDGCIYIRGDSGDPADIICGTLKGRNVLYTEKCEQKELYSEIEAWAVKNWKNFTYENTTTIKTPDNKYANVTVYFATAGEEDVETYYINEVADIEFEWFEPTLEHLGTVEALWNGYGGTINEKGYKVLESHVRAIYGDSITTLKAEEIYNRLEEKGLAANNVALGAGSFSLQAWEEVDRTGNKILKPHTRDTFGIAFKATYCEINGTGHQVYKDPKTDTNKFKKSQRGMVVVLRDSDGKLYAKDHLTREEFNALANENVMQPIFENGKMLVEEKLKDIRDRLNGNSF